MDAAHQPEDRPDLTEPVRLDKPAAAPDGPEVGAFRQGTDLSRWALSRYLIGRAVADAVGSALLAGAVVILALAALCWWGHVRFWAVVLAVAALGVLALRALLRGVLRRLTAVGQSADIDRPLRVLVARTRGDVLRELRRVGLPGRTLTLPVLGARLLRRSSRARTLDRLRRFDLDRAVPASRLDELHLLLRSGGAAR